MRISTSTAQTYRLTKESADLQTSVDAAIDAHNKRCDLYEASVGEMQSAGDDWSPTKEQAAARLRTTKIELLCDALKLRERIADTLVAFEADWQAARESAHQRHEALRDDVRAKLLKIGYTEFLASGQASGLEGMVSSHPEVKAALGETETLAAGGPNDARAVANQNEIRALRAELATIRQRSLAALG